MKRKLLFLFALLVSSTMAWGYDVTMSTDASNWAISSASPGATVTLTYNGTKMVKSVSVRSKYTNTYTINSTSEINSKVSSFNSNPGSRLVFNCNYSGNLYFTAAEGEIDLNGHTITGNVFVQNNTSGKTVVLKNGTISGEIDGNPGTSDFYKGTLVIDNMTLKGTLYNDGHYTVLYSGTYTTVNATKNNSTPGTVLVYTAGSTITSRTGTTSLYSNVTTTIPARSVTEGTNNKVWSFVMPHYNTVVEVEYYSFSGSGTSSSPYLIGSAADWNLLATAVNAGRTFSGKYIRQTANISVSTMVGVFDSKYFSGTYDGNGKTLTFNKTVTADNCAPFAAVHAATIQNLVTAGSITTSKKFAAGIISRTSRNSGTTTITNCRSSITINSSVSGDGTHGGFVGVVGNNHTVNMTGCFFNGQFLGGSTNMCGGLVGYTENATLNFTNCVYAPTQVTFSTTGCCTFSRQAANATVNINNCYYTQPLGTAQGKQAYSIKGADGVSVGNAGTLTQYNAAGFYSYGTNKGIMFGAVLYAASGESLSLNLSGASNGYLTSAGTLSGTTLTMAAANTTISKQLPGAGTENAPYTIGSAADWNTLATNVGLGHTYSGKYIKQTANITVSNIVGSYGSKAFSGTYDGDGHTITANINSTGTSGAAPFAWISGATINNFTVTGTVNGGIHCSAVVGGVAGGTNTISNIKATATVTCSTTHCGGIVGHGNSSTTTLEGCVFAGSISATGTTTNVGALCGWGENEATLTITNCLEAGTSYTATNFSPMGLSYEGNPTLSITNSYYKNADSGSVNNVYHLSGGKQAYTITAADGVTMTNAGSVGVTYNNKIYAGSGENVSLNLSGGSNGYLATAGTLSGTTLTMAAANTTISKQLPGSGTEGDPYTIGSADDWNTLATNVGLGHTYSGYLIKQTADISVSTMVGSYANSKYFSGTYDGDGKTLTFTINGAEDYYAPFRCVSVATIQNLYTTGSITTSKKFAAGLIASIYENTAGTVTVTNCRSSIAISSTVDGDGTHGGLVAITRNNTGGTLTLNITGCIFDGQLTTTNGTNNCGGLVGWSNGTTVNFTNCLFDPASVNINTDNGGSKTFSRHADGTTITTTNCYYTQTLGAVQGKQAYSATAPGDLAVANTGESTLYDVSGVTFYDTDKGFKYNDVIYAAAGEELKLTYNGSSVVKTISFNRQSANTYTINSTSDVSTQVGNFNANPGSRLVFNVDYTGDLTFTAAEGEIDLNGHTITGKIYVQNNVLGKTVVFKNGTISGNIDGNGGTSDFYAGTLIMDNITLTGTLFNDGHYTILYSGTYATVQASNDSSTPGTVLVYTAGSTINTRGGTSGLYSDVATAIPARATEKSYNQEWTIVMPHYNTVIAAEYDPWTYAADGNVLKAYGYGGYTE